MNEICQIYSGNETLLGSFEHYTAASPPWDFLLFIDSAATSWRLFTTHFWFWNTLSHFCVYFSYFWFWKHTLKFVTIIRVENPLLIQWPHAGGVSHLTEMWIIFVSLLHLFVMPVCFLNLAVCCIFRFVCCIYSLAAFLDAKASLHLPMSI